jgi:beta-glucosidase
VRYLDSKVTRPLKDLKGFERISLAAGESKTVTFTLCASQLAYYADDHFAVEPGTVEVMVGGSSVDIRDTAHLHVRS